MHLVRWDLAERMGLDVDDFTKNDAFFDKHKDTTWMKWRVLCDLKNTEK